MNIYRIAFVSLLLSACHSPVAPKKAARSSAVTSRDQMGVNVNSLVDPSYVAPTIANVQRLGAGWIRLEIDRAQPPSYWASVVQQLRAANIQVLAALTNVSWSGGAVDGDLQDPVGADPLNDPGCGSSPGAWGTATLVPQFISQVDPYVQALRANVQSWEIWNEANNAATALCPGNYAQLLAQARQSWPDIGIIGPSLLSIGSSGNAQNNSVAYLQALWNSDPSLALQDAGASPWDRVMLHPYPDEGGGDEDPTQYLPDIAAAVSFQSAPLWFTEVGYQSDNHAANACYLGQVFETAAGLAERTFWFALNNCVPNYGLLEACAATGKARPEFAAFIAEGTTGPIDTNLDPQNCGGCGLACADGQICQGGQCVDNFSNVNTADAVSCRPISAYYIQWCTLQRDGSFTPMSGTFGGDEQSTWSVGDGRFLHLAQIVVGDLGPDGVHPQLVATVTIKGQNPGDGNWTTLASQSAQLDATRRFTFNFDAASFRWQTLLVEVNTAGSWQGAGEVQFFGWIEGA